LDKTARIWDAKSGAEIKQLKGHTDEIWSVALTPDGARAVTVSKDTTTRIWDVATGTELVKFGGHTARVNSVAVTPDGTHVVTGSTDKSARLWDMPAIGSAGQTLIDSAKVFAPRCLTPEQRENYHLAAKAPHWCKIKWP
jgi:WD40 repeat protein